MKNLYLAPLSLVLAACAASTTPQYDTKFGEAVRQARQQQVINPQGTAASAQGLDGVAAKSAADSYRESFKSPPPVTNVINIGGSVAGGGR